MCFFYVFKGRSGRSRRQPNFFGNMWPSNFISASHTVPKAKGKKRMRSYTETEPRQYSSKLFKGLKSLRDYIPKESDSDKADDENSGN